MLASPHVAPLGIVVFAILLLLVAISMVRRAHRNALTLQIGISVRNILAGQSTIEVERARPSRKNRSGERRRFIWLPETDDAPGRVVRIDPDLKLYDLGSAANWRATMGERRMDWLCASCALVLALTVTVPWRLRCELGPWPR